MTITLEQARETLKSVVADFGPATTYALRYEEITGEDYPEFAGCSYQLGGTPACIVGVVLDRLGVALNPAWDESGVDIYDTDYREASVVSDIAHQVGLDVGAEKYLQMAQSKQDLSFTWGYALEAAEQAVAA